MKILDLTEAVTDPERKEYAKKVSKPAPERELEAFFKKHKPKLKTAINAYLNGKIIYRGVPNKSSMLLVDPTKVERKAANTFNYMNLLQSNLPSWSAYPPRNRSLICTTNYKHARHYGDYFVVLPFGDPVIGICPSGDWFDTMHEFGGPDSINDDFNDFYDNLKYLLESKDKKIKLPPHLPDTKKEFFQTLTLLDNLKLKYKKHFKQTAEDGGYFTEALLKYPTLVDGFNKLLNPKKHEFTIESLSNFSAPATTEVWFSAPALFIRPVYLNQYLNI
jgi:hypothetical protein